MDNVELFAYVLGETGAFFRHLSSAVSEYGASGGVPPSLFNEGNGRAVPAKGAARAHKHIGASGFNLFLSSEAGATSITYLMSCASEFSQYTSC